MLNIYKINGQLFAKINKSLKTSSKIDIKSKRKKHVNDWHWEWNGGLYYRNYWNKERIFNRTIYVQACTELLISAQKQTIKHEHSTKLTGSKTFFICERK